MLHDLNEVRKKRTIPFILLILVVFLGSCKIRYSFGVGSVPEEARTVSVNLFTNNAGLAGPTLPLKLTESLKDFILAQTKLYMVQTGADLQFTGMITGYDIRPVAIQANEVGGLNRLTITVQASYINKFDEKQNFTQTFSRFADYDSDKDLTSVEDQLMEEINKQLVQDIFDKAFSNW